jgi:ABC-type uncharacterized transport system auxiliary subunit
VSGGKRSRAVAAGLLALGGSGCSLMFQKGPLAEQTYFLRAANVSAPVVLPVHASLRVMHPAAEPGLDSQHIVLLQSRQRMGFYARSHWSADLPDLVEALAVETLRTSSSWASVEDSTSPFPSDYLLQITIRRFEADYGPSVAEPGAIPKVHVVLECLLGRGDGREVIASYVAEGSATPAENRLSEVVAAFQTASSEALKSLSERAFEAVRNDPHHPS